MLKKWTLSKLERVKDHKYVLVRDPLRMLPEGDGTIHNFARKEGFTVILSSTNLVFRELYEPVLDADTGKLLIIDRAPVSRRKKSSVMKAPPLFYPDFFEKTTEESRIDLDLRQYLIEMTGDRNWPKEVNEPRYARLIEKHLDGVIRAHKNLKTASEDRFTDNDFKTIMAYSVLGVPESAFKKLNPEDYWKIGILGYDAMEKLNSIAPEITGVIREELIKGPAPFCFIADYDGEMVTRAFYLSVILSQHTENWKLLLANIDPALKPLSNIKKEILDEAAPELAAFDKKQAQNDMENVENSLSKEALNDILLEQLNINSISNCAIVIEKEMYSTLIRSLAVILAMENLLSGNPSWADHKKIVKVLFRRGGDYKNSIVEMNSSKKWTLLKRTYELAFNTMVVQRDLNKSVKSLKTLKKEDLTFKLFREIWNDRGINKIEYFLSALERSINSGELLPRVENELPSIFINALHKIRLSIQRISGEVFLKLDELNIYFQNMVEYSYKSWVTKHDEVCLTSQFLEYCLKPNWDPKKEKAVVFIFDGMRYDIWDEFLRPLLEDFMEEIADIPASSILPSETHITRKAISAGTYPDKFTTHSSEDLLLKDGLKRVFGYTGNVEVLSPTTSGVGETVRYRASNLDVYILELCDKELHNISLKTLPDGRQVPTRPLSFVYEQHIKDIIDKEVMFTIRNLEPGTKVFITADHGFGRIHTNPLRIDEPLLNDKWDCYFLNARLKNSLVKSGVPAKIKDNVMEFSVQDLRMMSGESYFDKFTKETRKKQYSTVIFPRVGYSFCRPGSPFKPDAYTHGGISIQELLIPMIVLRVKEKEEGLIILREIKGPGEIVEGEFIEFTLKIVLTDKGRAYSEELRIDIEANYSSEQEKTSLTNQILYLSSKGENIVYRFKPDLDNITNEERRKGFIERTMIVTVKYQDDKRTCRKSKSCRFIVRLNSEKVIRRVPASLGNILGLTPKNR